MISNRINILFTGLSGNDSSFQLLDNSGKFNFIHFPTIEIGKSELFGEEKSKIKVADSYDYIVFTSTNAVKYFILHYENDLSKLNCSTKIVAIGEKTASVLLNNNIDVDLIPSNSSSVSLGELLNENLVHGKSILIPGSKLSKVDLLNTLESKGAMVDFVAVYENKIPQNILRTTKKSISEMNFDLFIFTSPSTFYNFLTIFEINDVHDYFSGKLIAAIGPVTTEAIEKHELKVNIIPSEYNLNSLTKEITNYYKIDRE
jgi:uroporphyrinogen-III synthase